MTLPSHPHPVEPASLWRRLAALLYDSLLILALWMIGAALVVVPTGQPIGSGNLFFQAYLLVLAMAYFAVCWHRGGQTLGMRAWKIRLESIEATLTGRQILVRLAVGLVSIGALGAGLAWSLVRADRACWHDLASATRIVHDPVDRSGL